MNSDSVMPSKVSVTVDADSAEPTPYSVSTPGDVTLRFTLPQAEYMYGCGATAIGMLLGYYDLYGYNVGGVRYRLNNLISGTISVNSRGSDGGSIYDMKDPSKLANFIASAGYISRFYQKTPSQELSYTFKYGDFNSGLNTGAWDCLADYLGTGQYWRGNEDLSTRHYNDVTLQDIQNATYTYTIDGKKIPAQYIDFKYGLSLYVQSVGYSLDAQKTKSATKESFSFEDFCKEIDADRPVLVHLRSTDDQNGHIVTAYGYNKSTRQIIFDDTYRTDCHMYYDGSYKYSGKYYTIKTLSTVVFVSSLLTPVTPEVISVKANLTAPTNRNVTVTATFNEDAATRQYSFNNSNWYTYGGSITVTQNGKVYFRGIAFDGTTSAVTTYSVTNIDRTAPTTPTVKASTTAPTNQNVTVTASFSTDSTKKQYSTDNKTWQNYTAALSVGKNATYYFRAVDAAGNVSKVASIKISNIDKTAPEAPTAKASNTKPTNQNVTVTASFSKDSAKKQYSTDNKTWSNYTKAISAGKNATYYFRGIDAAGNASKVTSIKISNIDKTPPTTPTVKANTTAPTNKDVKLTASFSKDSAKKQYSTDKKSWKDYSKAISVAKNSTYYFRAIDKVGNISAVATFKVTNIDKTAPNAPKVKVSSTKPTNQNVTLTVNFSKDSTKKQYSTNNKKWKTYTTALSVGKNATYYFRGVDAAGNVSKVTNIKIDNIDKTAPTAPTVKASSTKAAKSITITANFSKDSTKKQYSTDNKTWKSYSKELTVKANGTYYFRGIDAAGNVSKVKNVKVSNIVDTANNTWATAAVLSGTVLGALDSQADKVDFYDVDDVAKLMLDMGSGKAKVTFCDSNKKAVSVKVYCADSSERELSTLPLVAGDAATDNIVMDDLGDVVKYLKIESSASGLAGYRLAKLA